MVEDPRGVADHDFHPNVTNQPYATNLANRLNVVRKLRESGDSPAFNRYLNKRDRR